MKIMSWYRIAHLFLLPLALLCSNIRAADTLDFWKLRNPHISLDVHYKIDQVNGLFIAYSGPAGLDVSPDGTNWAVLPLPFDYSEINKITYGNGQYVVAGGNTSGSLLASSPDLTNWTVSAAGPERALSSVAFGGSLFVAGGDTGSVLSNNYTSFLITSPDGVHWTRQITPAYSTISDIAYGNGHFVATLTGGSHQVIVSTDGVGWTSVPFTNTVSAISFAAGRFYASGNYYPGPFNYPNLFLSTDGLTWGTATDPRVSGLDTFHAFSGNGILLGTGASLPHPLSVSADGTNFVSIVSNNYGQTSAPPVTFGNGLFVDSALQVSADGTNWSDSAVPPTNGYALYYVQDLFTGTNGYIAFTLSAPLLVSPDGIQFSFLTNTVAAYQRAKFANGLYHAVGSGGVIGRSTNGLDWEARTSATANSLHDIDYGNSTWVAVGDAGTITTSLTGNSWTLRTSGTSINLNGLVFGANQFVAVGASGTVLTSPDGISWTPQYSGTLQTLNKVTQGGGQYVAVGTNGAIATSANGVDWTTQTSGVQANLTDVSFGDGVFCAVGSGGNTNVVLTSTNGSFWTQRTSAALQLLTGGVAGVRFYNGTFFVFADTNIVQSGPVLSPQLHVSFNGNIPQVNVQSSSNLLFRLQSASSLTGPWYDCGVFTNYLGTGISYPDGAGSGASQRFYRVTSP